MINFDWCVIILEQLTNLKDQNVSITAVEYQPITAEHHYRLMKTSSMNSKRRDSHQKWPHRETKNNTLLLFNSCCLQFTNQRSVSPWSVHNQWIRFCHRRRYILLSSLSYTFENLKLILWLINSRLLHL